MAKKEAPIDYISRFIPPAASAEVLQMLHHYRVHLTVTKERSSVLGDYRHAIGQKAHRISVNGNLNRYSFLITLIHEIAHLITFDKHGNKVLSHGREWKKIYAELLSVFMRPDVFPSEIIAVLRNSLNDLPASSCADEPLMRVLKKYDQNGLVMVEDVKEGALFSIRDGNVFRKGKKLRKRFQCVEIKTGKLYLFSPVYEVKAV
jgi:SprT protein